MKSPPAKVARSTLRPLYTLPLLSATSALKSYAAFVAHEVRKTHRIRQYDSLCP